MLIGWRTYEALAQTAAEVALTRNPEQIIRDSKRVAVVGLSNNPGKESYTLAKYLQDDGYHAIPVNPTIKEVLGEKSYASLGVIPEPVDVVDVFRRPEAKVPIVHDSVAIGAKAFWLQLSIVNEEAAMIARNASLDVVMDKCIKVAQASMVRRMRR